MTNIINQLDDVTPATGAIVANLEFDVSVLRSEAINAQDTLKVSERDYAEGLLKKFGSEPVYDGKFFWQINKNDKRTDSNKVVIQELCLFYSAVTSRGHSNPSVPKGRIFKYAEELAFPKAPSTEGAEGDTEGNATSKGANESVSWGVRTDRELVALYKASYREKYAGDMKEAERDARIHIEKALLALKVTVKTEDALKKLVSE